MKTKTKYYQQQNTSDILDSQDLQQALHFVNIYHINKYQLSLNSIINQTYHHLKKYSQSQKPKKNKNTRKKIQTSILKKQITHHPIIDHQNKNLPSKIQPILSKHIKDIQQQPFQSDKNYIKSTNSHLTFESHYKKAENQQKKYLSKKQINEVSRKINDNNSNLDANNKKVRPIYSAYVDDVLLNKNQYPEYKGREQYSTRTISPIQNPSVKYSKYQQKKNISGQYTSIYIKDNQLLDKKQSNISKLSISRIFDTPKLIDYTSPSQKPLFQTYQHNSQTDHYLKDIQKSRGSSFKKTPTKIPDVDTVMNQQYLSKYIHFKNPKKQEQIIQRLSIGQSQNEWQTPPRPFTPPFKQSKLQGSRLNKGKFLNDIKKSKLQQEQRIQNVQDQDLEIQYEIYKVPDKYEQKYNKKGKLNEKEFEDRETKFKKQKQFNDDFKNKVGYLSNNNTIRNIVLDISELQGSEEYESEDEQDSYYQQQYEDYRIKNPVKPKK